MGQEINRLAEQKIIIVYHAGVCYNAFRKKSQVERDMAKYSGHFTDALVVIYDNENNFITQTIISGHNRGEMYIEITEGMENIKPGTRLHLLIIHSDGASEFGGTLKSVRQGIYEIPIYGERKREARGSTRHKMNAGALIKEITVDDETITLRDPVDITIEDISKTGILFKSPNLRFIVSVVPQIKVNVNGKETILYAKVVREQKNPDETFSFGCQLVFLK